MSSKAGFAFNGRDFDDQEKFIESGRRCCTATPSDLQIARVDEEIASFRRSAQRVQRVSINVQFNHILDGNKGKITEEQRVEQIRVLNESFNEHNVFFEYDPASVVEVDRPEWFLMGHRSASEREAKTALQVDPKTNLNIYTGGLQGGLLGWATFPFDLAGDPVMDGVVILHTAFPGGAGAPYNLGRTGTHEVGHWLGLYHTFEPRGRCDAVGDHVNDTVNHRNPDFGKPDEGVYSSCDGVSNSPIHNFMNYTDDEWMTEFTPEQGQRVLDQVGMYRPELAAPPDVVVETTELKFKATATGSLPRAKAEQTFVVPLPSKANITLTGPGSVDFDLYLKRGGPPTVDDYDQRAYSPGSDETLEVTPDSPGDYYVMARSYSGAGNFTLEVELA